jgi:hypothetical protein
MRVIVGATLRPIKAGIEARSPLLQLVGHGSDSGTAVESLTRAVRAWCSGLQRRGELEAALRRSGVRWEPIGAELEVEVETQSDLASARAT